MELIRARKIRKYKLRLTFNIYNSFPCIPSFIESFLYLPSSRTKPLPSVRPLPQNQQKMPPQINPQPEQPTPTMQSFLESLSEAGTPPPSPPPPPLSRSTTINAPPLSRQTTSRTNIVQHEIEMAALGTSGPKNPACLPQQQQRRQPTTLAERNLEAARHMQYTGDAWDPMFAGLTPFPYFLLIYAVVMLACWLSLPDYTSAPIALFMLCIEGQLWALLWFTWKRLSLGPTSTPWWKWWVKFCFWVAFLAAFWTGMKFGLFALHNHLRCREFSDYYVFDSEHQIGWKPRGFEYLDTCKGDYLTGKKLFEP